MTVGKFKDILTRENQKPRYLCTGGILMALE
jgi:hypothetical protein